MFLLFVSCNILCIVRDVGKSMMNFHDEDNGIIMYYPPYDATWCAIMEFSHVYPVKLLSQGCR